MKEASDIMKAAQTSKNQVESNLESFNSFGGQYKYSADSESFTKIPGEKQDKIAVASSYMLCQFTDDDWTNVHLEWKNREGKQPLKNFVEGLNKQTLSDRVYCNNWKDSMFW